VIHATEIVRNEKVVAQYGEGLNEGQNLPVDYYVARWYAAYTNANHEKRVAQQLQLREVQHFLPTYSSMRRWKDRRVTLQLPLFPGYVFVRMALRDRLRILQVPGLAYLVGFDGSPAALQDSEIESLREKLAEGARFEPHPYLRIGRRARVVRGPFQGMTGILSRRKNGARLVLSLDLISRSIALEIDPADLEPIGLTGMQ